MGRLYKDYARRLAIAAPRSPGERTVVTPAFSIAANLPSAVPAPPEAIAPAWPMRLPLGADAPAMKPTTGLVTCAAMNSAASSSAEPPIRSEEHTSELQSLMRISYAVFCLKKTHQIHVKEGTDTTT